MSRERKILDHLDTMAGPLGPFVSLDEWERERTTWAQRLSREDVGILVELLYHPPQGWSEGAEYEAVTALSTRGQCDRLWFLELARMTFARLGANAGLIEALGAAAPPGATDLLIDLATRAPLDRACSIAVIDALGEFRDGAALDWLARYHDELGSGGDPELLREIEIVLQSG